MAIVALVIVFWFGSDIRTILARLRKWKFLGTEVVLDARLDELQKNVKAAEAEIPIKAAVSGEGRLSAGATVLPATEAEIEEVLREAARSPRLGLMLLSSKIERVVDSQTGMEMDRPFEAMKALVLFADIRDRLVHGHHVGDDEIARAIDSGTRLLRLLVSRPPATPRAADRPG